MNKSWKKWILTGAAGIFFCGLAVFLYRSLSFADQKPVLSDTDAPYTKAGAVTRGAIEVIGQVEKDTSKELGTKENPFVILEIVPYEGYAEIGYLISGCEPVDMERLTFYGDMATVKATGLISAEWNECYYFGEEEEYQQFIAEEANKAEGLTFNSGSGEITYSKDCYGYYEKVEEGQGSFIQLTLDTDEGNADTEKTENYRFEWVGERNGDIAWHTLNDNSSRTEDMRQLLGMGERLYTVRNSREAGSRLYRFYKYDYENKDYFLKDTLKIPEKEADDFCVVVKTLTPEELNKSVEADSRYNWVTLSDLICIAPKSHINHLVRVWEGLNKFGKSKVNQPAKDFVKDDLSWETVMAIYNRVLIEEDYAALVMDATSYLTGDIPDGNDSIGRAVKKNNIAYTQINWDGELNTYNTNAPGCSNNIYKLGVMLRSMNPQLFYNLYFRELDGKAPLIEQTVNSGNGRKKTTGSLRIQKTKEAREYWNPYEFMPSNEDGSGRWSWDWDEETCFNPDLLGNDSVASRIYTYDGNNSLTQHYMDKVISKENYNYTKELFDWLEEEGKTPSAAMPSEAMDYILKDKMNGTGEKRYKADVHILELEPCNTFSLTARRFYFMLPDFSGEIYIEKQTTSEFIGKTEDLNSTYDMVYIGTNDATLDYTIIENKSTWVYRHTGSKVSVTGADKDSTNDNKKRLRQLRGSFGENDKIDTYYYSGNDITKIKQKELLSFARAGYPIVFRKDFFISDKTVNSKLIDSASNLYELGETIAGDGKKYTLYREGAMEADGTLAEFKEALSMPHCTLVLDETTPVRYKDRTYTYTDSSGQIKAPYANLTDKDIYINGADELYLQMDFKFRIDDDAPETQTYVMTLYIDTNADGKYVADEEQNVIVYDENNKQVRNTRLKAGVPYTLICKVDEYIGVLPWKLEVCRSDNKEIRDIQMGMSAVKVHPDPVTGETMRKDLRVLQVTSERSNKVFLPTDKERKEYENGTSQDKDSVKKKFHIYTKDLEEFNIHFDRLSVSQFIAEIERQPDYMEAKGYDMLILGFDDMYSDISSERALQAIETAIERGMSVLFTHDTTSFVNLSKDKYESMTGQYDYWGYHINKYFRNIVGMDRYGVTLQYPLSGKGMSLQECLEEGKDIPYKTDTKQGIGTDNIYKEGEYVLGQGATNFNLYRYSQDKASNRETEKVTQTNTGQVTAYPYQIDEKFTVGKTHGQYYQLDMEADDIVVWYCLSDDKEGATYSKSPNDVRNNYYIYNRGNITYSGVGHSDGLTDMEIKLFVNTMVAAYNASAMKPGISLTNPDRVPMGQAEALYVNYEYTEGNELFLEDFIEQMARISYRVVENNILIRKRVWVKYYLLGKETGNGVYTFAEEGKVLDGSYYTEEKGKRTDLHTLLAAATVEKEDDQVLSSNRIQANTEYYFDFSLLNKQGEPLFKDTRYIPLEIEVTLEYGKNLDKTVTVRKPVILYRRALFNLD